MIERGFIAQKTKELYIKKYIEEKLRGVEISQITLKKIPLGEKIIIHTNRPSLIVGAKGSNIKALTKTLKKDFNLENPQIEINEVKDIFLDAHIVAQRIASSLERFGSARFKGVGHKVMENVLNSGALGIELIISGKIPGARAKSWRFYQGYIKKCGDIALTGVRHAQTTALLKSGIIGIKVSIMPPDLVLPDHVEILSEPITVLEETTEKTEEEASETTVASTKKKKSSRKTETAEKKVEKSKRKKNMTEEKKEDAVAQEKVAVPEMENKTEAAKEEGKEESEEQVPSSSQQSETEE
ncbi:30S ribosomal protein S3 [Candidatus Woesearchaeota archaeon]|nr:30S ribosomal protein S3 [Candidatus Woesearchaeota archaeon]